MSQASECTATSASQSLRCGGVRGCREALKKPASTEWAARRRVSARGAAQRGVGAAAWASGAGGGREGAVPLQTLVRAAGPRRRPRGAHLHAVAREVDACRGAPRQPPRAAGRAAPTHPAPAPAAPAAPPPPAAGARQRQRSARLLPGARPAGTLPKSQHSASSCLPAKPRTHQLHPPAPVWAAVQAQAASAPSALRRRNGRRARGGAPSSGALDSGAHFSLFGSHWSKNAPTSDVRAATSAERRPQKSS